MFKKTVVATVVALGMSAAFAAQDNSGCQGNCPTTGGTVTNQGGTANGFGGNGGIGFGGSGGAGGNGGAGGSGVGVGVGGAGGSVVGSGNSSASGGAGGNVVGSGNSHATGGNVKNAGNSNNRNSNQASASNQGNNSAQSTSINVAGDTTNYQAPRIPVATATAPNIMPTSPCMGSSSAGGQGMSFGFSIGTSWVDENCQRLEQIRTVAVVLGDRETAAEMMMVVPAYAEAVKRLQEKKAGVVAERLPKAAPVEFVQTSYSLLGN